MSKIINVNTDNLSFEKVLLSAMKKPGVKIKRSTFLRKELIKYYPEEVVKKAIKHNPAMAGVTRECVNKISKQVIKFETTKVTAVSVVASIPGGGAAVLSATADITNYFVSVLRVVQQLAYLYGFEEFDLNVDALDAETTNQTLVFIGVMFGVQGASSCLNAIANALAKQVSKKLANKALTKGTVYPIVKKTATQVGYRMTKQVFADTVASAIPIAGAVISGGLTLAMFHPGCMKLRGNLMKYNLSNPEYYKSIEKNDNNQSESNEQINKTD